jgi:Leucine-rich repeat (LRR) protein
MKYLKKYEVFDLEDWDEIDDNGSFISWLKINYPKDKWDNIKKINCSNQYLTDLNGIENLRNLKELICSHNQLTELNGLESLRNLKYLYCSHNNYSLKERNKIKNYCKENFIYLNI